MTRKSLYNPAVSTPAQVDAFYVRLSRILRHYLDWRFDLRGGARTTEEILAAAQSSSSLPDRHDLLGRFLAHCDRVKFGGHQPEGGDSSAMLGTAVSFAKETADAAKRVPLARAGEVA